MTRTLVITSGKGGVGKTNISVNASLELAQRGQRVCLFDADLGMANVNILLGIHPELTLDDYIFNNRHLEEIILHTKYGIDIIPGSSGTEKLANLNSEKIADLTYDFSLLLGYDYFLIDTASGISKGVISFCLASTETILVITSEATSLTDAYALLKVLSSNGYQGTVKILVNKCSSVPQSKETYQRFKTAVDKHLNINIAPAGMVVKDINIETAVTQQTPVVELFPDTIASQCIRVMISNLIKDEEKTTKDEDFGEFWQRYFQFCHTSLALPDNQHPQRTPPPSEPIEPATNVDDDPQVSTPITSSEFTEEQPLISDNQIHPMTPFSENDGIIDPLCLASPIPLLSHAFLLQSSGELSTNDLLEIYTSDPALMAKAMQMVCNSANSSLNRITKIQQIIKQLGDDALANLLVTTAMRKATMENLPPSPIFIDKLWYHSYKAAIIAQHLAEITDYPYPEEAYLAALLHDIGRLALQSEYPDAYTQFPLDLEHTEEHLETEISSFGKNHATIGSNSLRYWNINNFIVDAVEYHAEKQSRIETAFPLVKIVYVACRLTQYPFDESVLNEASSGHVLLDLTPDQIKNCLESAEAKAQRTAEHFQLSPLDDKGFTAPEKTQAVFKRRVLNYALLQSALPCPAPQLDLQQILLSLHQGLDILFGINRVICFLPDSRVSHLCATGFPGCFAEETLADITVALDSKKSLISKAFSSGNFQIGMDGIADDVVSLADEQIIRSFNAQGIVCIPMVANGTTKGVMVFGIMEIDYPKIIEKQSSLEQFGGQSARVIDSSEQFGKTKNESTSHSKDSQGNLIHLQGNT